MYGGGLRVKLLDWRTSRSGSRDDGRLPLDLSDGVDRGAGDRDQPTAAVSLRAFSARRSRMLAAITSIPAVFCPPRGRMTSA
jgi:hypothetical protein